MIKNKIWLKADLWNTNLCPMCMYFCHLSSMASANPSANKDTPWWHSICKSHRARTRHIFCFLYCGESSAVFITILPACGRKWRTLKLRNKQTKKPCWFQSYLQKNTRTVKKSTKGTSRDTQGLQATCNCLVSVPLLEFLWVIYKTLVQHHTTGLLWYRCSAISSVLCCFSPQSVIHERGLVFNPQRGKNVFLFFLLEIFFFKKNCCA